MTQLVAQEDLSEFENGLIKIEYNLQHNPLWPR
jgi:hypothetical protein